MTPHELSRHFATFGVQRDEILAVLEGLDVHSIESMQLATDRFKELQDKARKGFRKVVTDIHPDRSDDPKDHARFNAYNEAMMELDKLTIRELVAMGTIEGLDRAHEASMFLDSEFEEAQHSSFMAMAKWYRGPLVPLGWQGNRGHGDPPPPYQEPPPPTDPSRTFIKRLPDE